MPVFQVQPPAPKTLLAGKDADGRAKFVSVFDDRRLVDYYYLLFDWHGYIRFLSLPHYRENPDVPLWELFIEPELSQSHIRPDTPVANWPERYSLLDAMTKSRRVVLLGDPGSGKSTIVDWLIWQFTRVEEGPFTQALGRLIPVPLVLRDLGLSRDVTWEMLLDQFLQRPIAKSFEGDRALLEKYLARGQGLILLDGLDEVGDPETRRRLGNAVWVGVDRFPNCTWLATSRIVGYDHVPLKTAESVMVKVDDDDALAFGDARMLVERVKQFSKAHVAPFDDRRLEQYVQRWFARREPEGEVERLTGKLLEAIHRNESILRIARVPNLLTLLTLIYRVRRQLPHGRVLLYDRIAEAYLESIDEFRGIKEHDYSLAQKKGWLAYVAFQMQRRREAEQPMSRASRGQVETSEILVDQPTVVGWLAQAIGQSHGVIATGDENAARREAESYLSYLGRRSGLLLPRGESNAGPLYAFQHLSFQEYFAAVYLAEQISKPRWLEGKGAAEDATPDDVRRYAGERTWRETLVFLFETLHERPPWADELAAVLFGDKFELLGERRTKSEMNAASAARASLLAELAVDPYSGLSAEKRQSAIRQSWTWELDRQANDVSFLTDEGSISGTLTDGGSESLSELIAVLAGRGASRLCLVDSSLSSVAPLERLSDNPTLKLLRLSRHSQLYDLAPLAKFSNLQWLSLDGCTSVVDLGPLAKLSNLQTLLLRGCTSMPDLTPLAKLSNLRDLWLNDCTGVVDLTPLAKLSNLHRLSLAFCTGVADLAPLAKLTNLQWLSLSGCTSVTDYAPVSHVESVLGRPDLDHAPVHKRDRGHK